MEDGFPFKVELHLHLETAFRFNTVWEFAAKRGISLPVNSIEELKAAVETTHPSTLAECLQRGDICLRVIAGSREAIRRLAYEFCEDCASQNIKYVEARYTPHLLANTSAKPMFAPERGDVSPRDVVGIIQEEFKKAKEDFGIIAKSILGIIHGFTDMSREILTLCQEFRDNGVVGVDVMGNLGNSEYDEETIKFFEEATRLGLHRTAHAGEAGDATEVQKAIDLLKAERIGHGYKCVKDDDVFELVRSTNVHLETCPHSSFFTGSYAGRKSGHPLKTFANAAMNFSINRDNSSLFDTTIMADEYKLAEEIGLTREQVVTSIFNAARSCFASDEERRDILKILTFTYGGEYPQAAPESQ